MSEVLAQLEKKGGDKGLVMADNTYYEFAWVGGTSKWQTLTYTDGVTFHSTSAYSWAGLFNIKGKSTMTFSRTSGMRVAGLDTDGTLTVIAPASSIDISAYDLLLVAQYESSTFTNNMKIS